MLSGRQLVPLLVLLLAAAPAAADNDTNGQPRIGLVLSGGGARGMAHVGVIRVLEDMRIPVHFVAGTSMGAIIGGLYASGLTAAELDTAVANADWPELFRDRPPRADLSFRRKSDEEGFLVDFDVGVGRDGLIVPAGLIQGEKLTLALRRLALPVATVRDFDQLPIPFRAVATDIQSGETIVLGSGDLAISMRASMSAPGVFKPVRVDGRVLVDGGIGNNLPISVAQDMGADILIVANVGFPLLPEEELTSAVDITTQMLTILIRSRANDQIALLGDADVLIEPALGTLGSQAFERATEAVAIGEAAARTRATQLSALSLSERDYRTYRELIRAQRLGTPVIAGQRVENESRLSPRVIESRLADQRGERLDLDLLERDIADIYGFDTFETVDYSLDQTEAGVELLVRSESKSWGPNYMRFGLSLEDDFQGTSNYNVGARLTMTELNRLGGELRFDAQVGENPRLFAEFYQPLDYASRWFVNPEFQIQRINTTLFDDGNRIAEFRSDEAALGLAAGRQFGNWGELRVTVSRLFGDAQISIGDPAFGGGTSDAGFVNAEFGYDTIDRIAIPTSGTALDLVWGASRRALGAEEDFELAGISLLKPFTWGRNTLLQWWEFATAYDVPGDPFELFTMGGLFNLSGYTSQELRGRHLGIGRMIYYRRVGKRSFGPLSTTVYVGGSVEAGNVWQDTSDIEPDNVLFAGSLFVVLDTFLGPLYLAYGKAEDDRQSLYLFLGQTF